MPPITYFHNLELTGEPVDYTPREVAWECAVASVSLAPVTPIFHGFGIGENRILSVEYTATVDGIARWKFANG